MRYTGIPAALRKRGLKVEVVPGWETRGSSIFDPKGVGAHWIGGVRNATGRPGLSTVVNGRPDLPGPLCNVYLDRNGVAVVVAAGRANHFGYGVWKGLTGNSKFFGLEPEARDAADFTAAQRKAYPLACAALLDVINQKDASYVASHSEYALPKGRKSDINGYTIDSLRAQTQAVIRGQVVPAATTVKPKPVATTKSDPSKMQSWTNQPNGSTTFPSDYAILVVDGGFGKLTVGAIQILMESIKIGVRYNERWDGDWDTRTVKDVMEWLQKNGYYLRTASGAQLIVDGDPGFFFWWEFQRFLKARKFYSGIVDGKPRIVTYKAIQSYLNTQNGN